jgi:hypothetical protein
MSEFSFRGKGKNGLQHTTRMEKYGRQAMMDNYSNIRHTYPDAIGLQNIPLNKLTQWDMVETYCWLRLGRPDEAWGRYKPLSRVPHSFNGVGMSREDALTDEDEFVLEFGTDEEKKKLVESIKLSTSYRFVGSYGIQRKFGETWEDVLTEKIEDDVNIEEI